MKIEYLQAYQSDSLTHLFKLNVRNEIIDFVLFDLI